MDVFTKQHDLPFYDLKQKSHKVVKLTRTIIKTILIVMYMTKQSFKLYRLAVILLRRKTSLGTAVPVESL